MHYRTMNFLLVFAGIAELVKCAECGGKVDFKSCSKEGLAFDIQVKCNECRQINYVPSSTKVGRRYEVNLRFAFIMRLLGVGLAGCNKFCGLMDMCSSFLSKTAYNVAVTSMLPTIKTVANNFFWTAAQEKKKKTNEENNIGSTDDVTASGDGTWQTRGFASLYGVATLIGYYSGKVIDLLVKSGHCLLCKMKESKLNTAEFDEWKNNHVDANECSANHTGPSGNMEVTAMQEMFARSEEQRGVRYTNYIGDGDSKTYSGIVNCKPYGENVTINKKECVGHVQKRMGKRLRDLVKNTTEDTIIKTGKNAGKTRKSKTLSGEGNLTAKMIDKLTVYYGNAIRGNSDSVDKMKKAIWATFYHYSSTDEDPQHYYCPPHVPGDKKTSSWCGYQKALVTGESYEHDYEALPQHVLEALKPIYEDLSSDALLERCLGGFTQNNNESLNGMIWRITPKNLSAGSKIVEIAANVAACNFNEGASAFLSFMDALGISVGPSAHEYVRREDERRIDIAQKAAEAQTKEARVRHRQQQKDALDLAAAAGNVLYGAGIDDSV